MYRKFVFEGDVHEKLDCVPLAVRRKLDLAALKISLEGWQTLPREDRLALCHLPVDADEELAVYREIMCAFAARAGVALKQLEPSDPASWSAGAVPLRVKTRLAEMGKAIDDERWRALAEEERYAVVKYADPKRGHEKLAMLIAELGCAS